MSTALSSNGNKICFIMETGGSVDSPVEAAELQLESQQTHTDSDPYNSTHLWKNKVMKS